MVGQNNQKEARSSRQNPEKLSVEFVIFLFLRPFPLNTNLFRRQNTEK